MDGTLAFERYGWSGLSGKLFDFFGYSRPARISPLIQLYGATREFSRALAERPALVEALKVVLSAPNVSLGMENMTLTASFRGKPKTDDLAAFVEAFMTVAEELPHLAAQEPQTDGVPVETVKKRLAVTLYGVFLASYLYVRVCKTTLHDSLALLPIALFAAAPAFLLFTIVVGRLLRSHPSAARIFPQLLPYLAVAAYGVATAGAFILNERGLGAPEISTVVVEGTLHNAYRPRTYQYWLQADRPVPVFAQNWTHFPLSMWHRFALKPRGDNLPELYMVTVNAGFLGLPFVEDIRSAKTAAEAGNGGANARYGVWSVSAGAPPAKAPGGW
ncbi:hypothetical protein F6X40_35630 [Paraburkholderia sp. UCT31]|uniref:hypothetical protein n=1 Tax=Paraburkholderia sp. UCT31 TaxID=2615209 RepID=UPI00165521C9|nr:hypothetical protein [Paraburkholderia sp. UCT31]MBC8741882.1 hypothetical protein [Paraburkholderia sp. UCT31]